MMKRIFFTAILIILSASNFHGQTFNSPEITKPEGSVASLMRFSEIPVSNYTGIPNVSVPIYNIPTRSKDIPLNLSLGYHPSSIGMGLPAGDCGIGWGLFAGGVISRDVINLPDEYNNGVGYSQNSGSDIYQFSFLEHSGRFYLEKDSQGALIVKLLENPNSKLVITVNYNATTYVLNSFTIYDDKGYKYLFQDHDTQTYGRPNPVMNFKNSFHLTKVTDNNNKDLITITYYNFTEAVGSYTNTYKKIQDITSNGYGKVNFIYSSGSNFTYNTNIRLTRLDLLDYNGVLIKKHKLFHDYNENLYKVENCSADESIKETYEFKYKDYSNYSYDGTFTSDEWGYRKFVPNCLYTYPITNLDNDVNADYCDMGVLTEVVLPTGGSIQYKYESNTYSIYGRAPEWQLTEGLEYYYNDSMPQNYTVSTLGYNEFSGNGTNTYSFTVPGTGTNPVSCFINFEVTSYTAATIPPPHYFGEGEGPIFYPSMTISGYGLSTHFLSDQNNTENLCLGEPLMLYPGKTYTVTIGAYGNNNKIGKVHITKRDNKPNPSKNLYGAGVRIKEIAYFDKSVPNYFSDVAYYNSISVFPAKHKSYSYNFFQTDRSSGVAVYPSYDAATNARICREAIGYRNVTITETGMGREELTFTSPMDYNYPLNDPNENVIYYDYRRGALSNKKIFDANNTLLNEEILTYDYVETPASQVMYQNPGLNERLGFAKLKQKITKNYFSNSSLPLTQTENFTYDDAIRKLSTKSTVTSLGEIMSTKYSYHTGNSTYSQNRIGEIEKIENFRGSDLLFTKKILYNIFAGNASYLPYIVQNSKGSQSLENSYSITTYDEYSNALQTRQENGTYTTYIWGYNKTKIVAKIENATNIQVAGALGLPNVNSATEANLTAINALRNHPAFAESRITTYTHIPLIGFGSITDPKGDKLTYEYDKFHRLKTVRDRNNKILNENIYYQAQNSSDLNAITGITYKTETSTAISNPTIADAVLKKVFVDGLARPIQEIAYQQSNTGKDIVTHTEYDLYGREIKNYLPYANSASSLNYNPNAKTELLNYPEYLGQNPYNEKRLENSPLARPLELAAPGSDWSMANATKHTQRYDYQTNLTNDNVRKLRADANEDSLSFMGYYGISLVDYGFYPAQELYKYVIKNENWKPGDGTNNTTEEYKDKEDGKLILTRTYGVSVINGVETNTAHDTYHVYDQYGNLTYTIPPAKANSGLSPSELDDVCYQYRYDYRNRLVEKKLPGKQWEFIVYDKLNRIAAFGPTLSPFTDAAPNTNGWLITKYDAFNRKVLAAWQTGTTTSAGRKALQNSYTTTGLPMNESKSASDTTVNNVSFRYTTAALPTSGYHVLTVNYYDTYNYTNAPTAFTTVMDDNSQDVYYNNSSNLPRGLVTGSWSRFLEASTAIPVRGESTYALYNAKAKGVRIKATNYLGGYVQLDNRINFSGQLLATEAKHKRLSNDPTEIFIKEAFTYSAQGRLLTHTHQIGNGAIQTLSNNTYDELGKLTSKKVGTNPTNGTALQKMDYSYNIRGWLTEINKTSNLTQGTDPQDLFAMKINYNTIDNSINNTVSPLYDGNIAEIAWRTKNDNKLRRYGYQYDALNRLKLAVYQKPEDAVPVTNSYNESMKYDMNGNIMSLQRNGEYDDASYALEIDNLTYEYDTNKQNQLLRITDNSGNNKGFLDGNGIGDDYTYDANGNLTSDKNKGIVNGGANAIVYNHLNLPTKIIFGTNIIEYFYDAAGRKLKKVATLGSNSVITEYHTGFQYTQTNSNPIKLDFFVHKEGYVKNTIVNNANFYNYAYNYTDHLGNVRMSFGLDANNVLKILEESNYYPLGLKHQNYNVSQRIYNKTGMGNIDLTPCATCPRSYSDKFNGKSWEEEMGLNITAMDYRQYDNAIGRFNCIDPLAEMSTNLTPYHFGNNNPNYWADPSGLKPRLANLLGGGMPAWLQGMWDATPEGYNSTWNNVGGGNFEIVSFWVGDGNAGGGGGGGGSAGFGGGGAGFGGGSGASGNGFGGMIGFWVSSDGTLHAPLINDTNSTAVNNSSLVVPGAIPLLEVVVEQRSPAKSGFLDAWGEFNNRVVAPINGVVGIFEQGAIYGGTSISTANAFNKKLLTETLTNARLAKVAGNISLAGNLIQVGHSVATLIDNPSWGNAARVGVQVGIIAVEGALNSVVPGLGIIVGLGLSGLEGAYGQQLYDYIDGK